MRSVTRATATIVFSFLLYLAGPSFAQEFRIETDVFLDDQKEPQVETLTIFTEGVVYDFLLTGVEEITLFDRERNRLVLMDTKRKVKTELTMDSMLSFVAQMKSQLNDAQREFLLGEDKEAVTDDDGWLKLANDRVTYRAEGIEPKEKSAVLEYQQFADWYARLNAMRGNLPPFLRIRMNSEIAKRGLIPKTIERTMVLDTRGLTDKRQVLRSQHLANWRLSNTDRKQIDRAGTYLATYPTVTFREYMQLPGDEPSDGRTAKNDE